MDWSAIVFWNKCFSSVNPLHIFLKWLPSLSNPPEQIIEFTCSASSGRSNLSCKPISKTWPPPCWKNGKFLLLPKTSWNTIISSNFSIFWVGVELAFQSVSLVTAMIIFQSSDSRGHWSNCMKEWLAPKLSFLNWHGDPYAKWCENLICFL